MQLIAKYKILFLMLVVLIVGSLQPSVTYAADKKDKSAKRAQMMMQKMKQDMEAEKRSLIHRKKSWKTS